jgi:hypothetical protein
MTTNQDHLREVAKRLAAPAYWFTAGFDNRTGHWFSGSSDGHEGENDLPLEASKAIDSLLDELDGLPGALALAHRIIGEQRDELAALRKENEGLRSGINAVSALIDNSQGVYGLHLNGDPSPWSELQEGGRFEEWLYEFDTARAAIGDSHE